MASRYPIIPGVTFKDIPGFVGYCAGDDGSVWSCYRSFPPNGNQPAGRRVDLSRWRPLAIGTCAKGYKTVSLSGPQKRIRCSLHRIILETFVGPRPEGMECCHGNGNPGDNRLSNLRWDTHPNNAQDMIRHGRVATGSRNGSAKLTASEVEAIRRRAAAGEKRSHLAKEFRISKTSVDFIVRGLQWSHTFIADTGLVGPAGDEGGPHAGD